MKHAVIYARYSSEKQNDMSIEGQIAECRKYAEVNGFVVVREYIDRAFSATTDKRPEFQRMIEDSKKKSFGAVIVYQLDRFARNMFDAGYYAKILRDNGAELVSAVEHIAGDSSGVVTTAIILGMAEWYSKQLSEKVTRGMYQNAQQCKYNGGNMTFGYKIDEERHFILDEMKAPIVKEIFRRYSEGETGTSIMEDLNKRGIKTSKGKPFTKNSLQKLLRNEKYKGIYIYGDIRVPDGIPRIIEDELFDEVQEILGSKPRGHRPAIEDYLLTGVLYCGECKSPMIGTSGTSGAGSTYRYYRCTESPKSCNKKNVKKEYIESLVFSLCKELLTDDVIEDILEAVKKVNESDQESIELIRLRKDIKATEEKIERLLDQIEEGSGSAIITDRLKKREAELESLKKQFAIENAKQLLISPEMVYEFLTQIKSGEIDCMGYRRMLVKVFIDKIYLYDDKYRILFKYSGKRTKEKTALEIERHFDEGCSSTSLCSPPLKRHLHGELVNKK